MTSVLVAYGIGSWKESVALVYPLGVIAGVISRRFLCQLFD